MEAVPLHPNEATGVRDVAEPGPAVWEDHAACAELSQELFFPEQGDRPDPARRVCRQCPVRQRCLEFALARPELVGVWGATNEHERRQMRREAAQAPKAA